MNAFGYLLLIYGVSLALNIYLLVKLSGRDGEIRKLIEKMHWKDRVIVELANKNYELQEFLSTVSIK